ncbi:hypothetical protein XH87_00315 [Bradyrhizobium sp. CCBAU 53415]|nr:hypothetical protein [Bradyrhizobium sp. CCBAU 53415]
MANIYIGESYARQGDRRTEIVRSWLRFWLSFALGATAIVSLLLVSLCQPLHQLIASRTLFVPFDLGGLFNEGPRLLRIILHLRGGRSWCIVAVEVPWPSLKSKVFATLTASFCLLNLAGHQRIGRLAESLKLTEPSRREKQTNPLSV